MEKWPMGRGSVRVSGCCSSSWLGIGTVPNCPYSGLSSMGHQKVFFFLYYTSGEIYEFSLKVQTKGILKFWGTSEENS